MLDGKVRSLECILNNDDLYKGRDSYIKMAPDQTAEVGSFSISSFRSDDITLGYLIVGNGLRILYTGFPGKGAISKNLDYVKSRVGKVDILLVSTAGMEQNPEELENWTSTFIDTFGPRFVIPKDNKGNLGVYNQLEDHLSVYYPDVQFYHAIFPGDRRHVDVTRL